MMKKRILFYVILGMLVNSLAWADVIYLNNGKKIEGKVLEQSPEHVKIDVRGVPLTYFADEIDRVETKEGVTDSFDATAVTGGINIDDMLEPSRPQQDPETIAPAPVAGSTTYQDESFQMLEGRSIDSMNKDDLILAFINISGMKDNMIIAFDQILESSPPEESQVLKEILDIDEIISQVVPVYNKYFSEDEMKKMVSFYASPVGKKMLRTTPAVMEESMKASLMYFQKKIEGLENR